MYPPHLEVANLVGPGHSKVNMHDAADDSEWVMENVPEEVISSEVVEEDELVLRLYVVQSWITCW